MIHSSSDRELLKILARNDWAAIQELAQKKTYQRKFQIIEAFIELVGRHGIHVVVYNDIAKQCAVTRQLVEHHFSGRDQLIQLSYRYLYARLQRHAAESLITQRGFLRQLRAYLEACAQWVRSYPYDNQFLMQVYAIYMIDPSLRELFQRNLAIGNERLCTLLKSGRAEGYLRSVPDRELPQLSSSLQQLIIGYATVAPSLDASRLKLADRQLWRACMALLGVERRE